MDGGFDKFEGMSCETDISRRLRHFERQRNMLVDILISTPPMYPSQERQSTEDLYEFKASKRECKLADLR
jgi:hypothetical protein